MPNVTECTNPIWIYFDSSINSDSLFVRCDSSTEENDPSFNMTIGVALYYLEENDSIELHGTNYTPKPYPRLFVIEGLAGLTDYTVKSSIRFYNPNELKYGKLYGGKVTYRCTPNPVNNTYCNIQMQPITPTTIANRNLKIGLKDKFHLSIIGVDDIRASVNSGSDYIQIYPLEQQELY